jgi:hypothetical protein
MTPSWVFQAMWFGAGVGGSGAIWYFLSQRNHHAALWTGFATAVVVLLTITLHLRNNLLRSERLTSTASPSPAPSQTSSATPSTEAARKPDEPRVFLREKSPSEVVARVKSLNPLERSLVARQTYVGRWVRWSGTIHDIAPYASHQSGGFTVAVGSGTFGSLVFARLAFLPTEKHMVEPLEEGDLISYEGKITDVVGNDIHLTSVTVAPSEAPVFADVTPEKLMRFFEDHTDIQANARVSSFIGRWMKVSGRLGSVSAGSQVSLAGGSPVHMFFRKKKWVDRLVALGIGDRITVVGQIALIERGNLVLDNCEFTDP